MNAIRPAAVAGFFYPGQRERLSQEVDSLLQTATLENRASPLPTPKAFIVPHAGYIYSGPIAARAYACLQPVAEKIQRVILLGPTHRVAVRGLVLPDAESFATPLGQVPIDAHAVQLITDLPQVSVDRAAHAEEHAIEVQLPFLQRLLKNFQLLPLAVGRASPTDVAQVLDRLWGGPETVILISSDLSHYLPYAQACQMDKATTQNILTLSEQPLNHQQACGATPVNGLVLTARTRGLQTQLLDLRNSGDTAGDRERVVGYTAIAFSEASHAP